ncbi:MAG: YHS domain-containing (seleno)protein [Gammaproteobacteria bacterium]
MINPVPTLSQGIKALFFLALALAFGWAAWAEDTVNIDEKGVAISGYDPVAFFKQGRAMRGDASLSANHNGVTYYFANADDRVTFLANPNKFAPQYGGFCAFNAAKGKKVASDPENFKLVNGKLYLTASAEGMKAFSSSLPSYISKADEIWARIKDKKSSEL